MTVSLPLALAEIRELLSDREQLVKAVASGRQRAAKPTFVKTQLRPVQLKGEVKLQVSKFDGQRPTISNLDFGDMDAELDNLLAEPYGNWLVETTTATVQMRVTKRGAALMHRVDANRERDLAHDRTPPHLISADDPLFSTLGAGAAKRRQVDAFLRAVAPWLASDTQSVNVADLGCGNAYLTFAMYRYLSMSGHTTTVTGVDVRDDQRERNTTLAQQLGFAPQVRFVAGSIADTQLCDVDTVLALHACDTATDDALARGIELGAQRIVAAPCCHHDIAAQLRQLTPPAAYTSLVSDGILRERFADVLTDALRATILRLHGYRVDVIEFIDSTHTPRNTLLRARYMGHNTDAKQREQLRGQYDELLLQWKVMPQLAKLLPDF